jgi:hypothetical protein
MKYLFLFLFFICIGILVAIFFKQHAISSFQQPIKTPLSTVPPFSLAKPPPNSVKGFISSFAETVQWQAREATEPAMLLKKQPVLQGEEFWTNEEGEMKLLFPSLATITVGSNTHISLIQTLPESFVIYQDSGSTIYTNIGKHALSIRMPPLLLRQASGILHLEQDAILAQIILTVTKGSVTLGFNNSENISTVVTIKENTRYIFDKESRTGVIETL